MVEGSEGLGLVDVIDDVRALLYQADHDKVDVHFLGDTYSLCEQKLKSLKEDSCLNTRLVARFYHLQAEVAGKSVQLYTDARSRLCTKAEGVGILATAYFVLTEYIQGARKRFKDRSFYYLDLIDCYLLALKYSREVFVCINSSVFEVSLPRITEFSQPDAFFNIHDECLEFLKTSRQERRLFRQTLYWHLLFVYATSQAAFERYKFLKCIGKATDIDELRDLARSMVTGFYQAAFELEPPKFSGVALERMLVFYRLKAMSKVAKFLLTTEEEDPIIFGVVGELHQDLPDAYARRKKAVEVLERLLYSANMRACLRVTAAFSAERYMRARNLCGKVGFLLYHNVDDEAKSLHYLTISCAAHRWGDIQLTLEKCEKYCQQGIHLHHVMRAIRALCYRTARMTCIPGDWLKTGIDPLVAKLYKKVCDVNKKIHTIQRGKSGKSLEGLVSEEELALFVEYERWLVLYSEGAGPSVLWGEKGEESKLRQLSLLPGMQGYFCRALMDGGICLTADELSTNSDNVAEIPALYQEMLDQGNLPPELRAELQEWMACLDGERRLGNAGDILGKLVGELFTEFPVVTALGVLFPSVAKSASSQCLNDGEDHSGGEGLSPDAPHP